MRGGGPSRFHTNNWPGKHDSFVVPYEQPLQHQAETYEDALKLVPHPIQKNKAVQEIEQELLAEMQQSTVYRLYEPSEHISQSLQRQYRKQYTGHLFGQYPTLFPQELIEMTQSVSKQVVQMNKAEQKKRMAKMVIKQNPLKSSFGKPPLDQYSITRKGKLEFIEFNADTKNNVQLYAGDIADDQNIKKSERSSDDSDEGTDSLVLKKQKKDKKRKRGYDDFDDDRYAVEEVVYSDGGNAQHDDNDAGAGYDSD